MNDIRAIVFDLYGTLFNVHSVAALCDRYYPRRGLEVSTLWRQKQLEYTWLRSLMAQYVNFEQATAEALTFTCAHLDIALDDERRVALCEAYLRLTPFPEVPGALAELNRRGVPLGILSNGSHHSIDAVVSNAGLKPAFKHLISVEDVRVFKPHSRVYELAEQTFGLSRSSILFVSSNAWDATGAAHFGYPTCWVRRGQAVFDELGQQPDHIVSGIDALADRFIDAQVA
ncbi:haloacid dehalogenase type II [soil metagenome]